MSTYTPEKAEQQTYTQPVDGDDPETLLARILAFLQGLADGAAAGARIGCDWKSVTATGFNAVEACFDTVDQAWWIVGSAGTDELKGSWDHGRQFSAATLGSAVTLVAVATDANGNGLALAGDGSAYFGTRTAFATVGWVHTVGVLPTGPATGGKIGLCYDAVHGNWITVYEDAIVSIHARYLHTGTAFAAATIPASWTTATGWSDIHVQVNSLGDAIAAMLVTGGFLLSRSSDGGQTWLDPTTVPALPVGFTAGDISRPTYDPILDEWYVVIGGTVGGNNATHVLRSTDAGVTWTDTGCATPKTALVSCEAINGVLVAIDVLGRILRSVDRGVTWSHTAFNSMGNASSFGNLKLRVGDGQLLEISRDDAHVCASAVVGAKGGTAQ